MLNKWLGVSSRLITGATLMPPNQRPKSGPSAYSSLYPSRSATGMADGIGSDSGPMVGNSEVIKTRLHGLVMGSRHLDRDEVG